MANGDKLSYANIDVLHRIRGMVTDICDDVGIDRHEEA
jgi:hypothetical protein